MKNLKQILFAALAILAITAAFAFTYSIEQEEHDGTSKNPYTKKTSLIIVGHGAPATDFPKLKEYFSGGGHSHGKADEKFEKLEDELIHWPRTEANDHYWSGFMKIVKKVEQTNTYNSVHPAFNEFCAPTVEEALMEAASKNPEIIVLTSIMMTPGGGHSEEDIPASIEAFKKKNPGIRVIYAWPYDINDVSQLLINQTNKFIPRH